MTIWEYHKSRDEEELEALGREGWELVAVLPGSQGADPILYFKRPAPDFRERVTLDQKRRYYNLMGIEAATQDDGTNP
jgi:hypothetical protein